MCISVAVSLLSVVVGAAGSFMAAGASAAAAQSEAKWNAYNLEVQNQQLKEEQEMVRLKAQSTEADRLAENRRMRGRNEAFMAMSGLSENQSFLQGADVANEDAKKRDVATLRLNSAYQVNRIADQIAVNKANAEFGFIKADMASDAAWTKAAFSTASSALSFGSDYFKFKTPGLARA